MGTWILASSVVSPLGVTSAENYAKLRQNETGISSLQNSTLSAFPFMGAQIKNFGHAAGQTKFENLCIKAAEVALDKIILPRERSLYILSTTKGNVDQLGQPPESGARLTLHSTAQWLADRAGFAQSMVVSNACISGVLSLMVAKRFLESGKYDNVLVVGCDVLSKFVVSGFQSLNALSDEVCRPFDISRKGINLGEAAAAILLSTHPPKGQTNPMVKITGGGSSNDANHISGPSRSGDELKTAIQQALHEAGKSPEDIDFISAHGTATLFNDEMEAKAFDGAGLENCPVNSLKGYFGHTLGAAGIVETAMSIQSLLNDELLATYGFERSGVSRPIHVLKKLESIPLKTCLKTASGFGGCNAAVVLEKE